MSGLLSEESLAQVAAFIEQGGFVMYPLVATAFLVWFALGYRLFVVRRGSVASLESLVERHRSGRAGRPRGIVDDAAARGARVVQEAGRRVRLRLDDAFAPLVERMGAYAVLARAAVLVAPLLGLLGTVTGMIEMFDSLATQTLYSQSGGIARGISEALFTTELGLGVAIPGLVIGGMLDRRQERIATELERLKDLLCGGGPAAEARA